MSKKLDIFSLLWVEQNGFAAINGCALIERGANCEMSSAQCADATPIGFPFAGVLDTLVKRVPLGS
ncbi:hypothetical protein C0Q70_16828 [Pomacea canaliculata]|uniref:Uncharacterized protein n=1 Tax=Pomacea canaliculata TaxID=400727 RepID=A0A2T7NQX6_POMCA|nr:hypothetical protein C0Q70_16828 [Pomacea canaliculata]